MRLLKTTEPIELKYFADNVPPYAILSHTWGDEEVTFQDMEQGQAKDKKGYTKIRNCCSVARSNGYNHVWIDTCCIDKTSSAELTEAINSMYRYYREAEVCYSFLSDISSPSDLTQSRWFTRGWTLQELIAPTSMIFFNKDWQHLGTKASLGGKISEHTGVPQAILSGTEDLESASIAQRMSWAAGRKTTRLEDRAYSLMGIFDINMPLLYGEGHKAFIRLQEEILRVSDDHSIFAWRHTDTRFDGGLLAETPDAFKDSKNIIPWNPFTPYNSPFTVTNKGVHLDAPFIAQAQGGLGLMVLHCTETGRKDQLVGIYLRDPFLTMEHFERCRPEEFTLINLGQFSPSQYPTRNLCISLRGKASSRTQGSSVSKHQELQPRHSTEGDQNPTTEGVEDAEADELAKVPRESLLLAASEGNEATVKKLLALPGIDADSANNDKRTALSLAAEAGHELIVHLLLNRREVDINSRDKHGLSPLSYAAALGYEKVVWILLARADIKVDSQDVRKRTAVCLAAGCGHTGLVGRLLARKDTCRYLADGAGRSVLSYAAEGGHEAVVRLILSSGKVHPDLRDKAGCSALWYASKNGHAGLVKLLLETSWVDPCPVLPKRKREFPTLLDSDAESSDVESSDAESSDAESSDADSSDAESNDTGSLPFSSSMFSSQITREKRPKTALSEAASRGHHVIVQLLLDNHLMSLESPDCLTALHRAARMGHVAVINVIREKCPRGQDWSHRIFSAFREAFIKIQPASLSALVKYLKDVEVTKPRLRDAYLCFAVLSDDESITRVLLEKGADANSSFDDFEMMEAVGDVLESTSLNDKVNQAGFMEATQYHVPWFPANFQYTPQYQQYSPNALWFAVVKGVETMVETLLEYGADTEAEIKNGTTVLFSAISLGHISIVRLLLKHDANIEARNLRGWSPLIFAASLFVYEDVRQDKDEDIDAIYEGGEEALMDAAVRLAMVEQLLKLGADVNARGIWGTTALMEAVSGKKKTDVVKLLLEHRADVAAKDDNGRTAASLTKDEAMLSLLREYAERS